MPKELMNEYLNPGDCHLILLYQIGIKIKSYRKKLDGLWRFSSYVWFDDEPTQE